MNKTFNTFAASIAVAAALGSAATVAAAQYVGPSNVPVMTVKQLLDTGRDDQHATLRGRIVAHGGGDHYTFADDSGQIRADISARHFPQGQPIDDKQVVEITGEFEKEWRGDPEFDVERLTVVR